ncbi:MAG: hypothetical protein K0R65_2202 [Crocinitomicaceae bacterium]|jgi:peptidoglycan/xylan/chitin deacetylase (PgdA/CDA1 family)|nr:hypothetical protein [Crocinitomicaceae bacterium]
MAGFREKFIRSSAFAAMLPVKSWVRLTGQPFVVPVYHTVSDQPLDHIRHLYPVKNTQQFEKDLDFLLKNYRPLDLNAAQQIIVSGEKPRENSFFLTFDDGLSEFCDIIAPILERKGVPAMCFLNSAFVDNKDLFFRYKVSLLIQVFEQNPKLEQSPAVHSWKQEIQPASDLRSALLSCKYDNNPQLNALAKEIGYSFDDYLQKEKPYLESAQVESLIKKGFYFGSHSVDHPEYRLIDFEMQMEQTRESMHAIRDKFGLDYRAFAFPFTDFGVSTRFFREARKQDIFDFSFACAGLRVEQEARHFQRIPFEIENLSAERILKSEYFYFLVKSLFNKQKMQRHD